MHAYFVAAMLVRPFMHAYLAAARLRRLDMHAYLLASAWGGLLCIHILLPRCWFALLCIHIWRQQVLAAFYACIFGGSLLPARLLVCRSHSAEFRRGAFLGYLADFLFGDPPAITWGGGLALRRLGDCAKRPLMVTSKAALDRAALSYFF
jgi:hypothetical protein